MKIHFTNITLNPDIGQGQGHRVVGQRVILDTLQAQEER